MTQLPEKRNIRAALEKTTTEVRAWPVWKQQLAMQNDFRSEQVIIPTSIANQPERNRETQIASSRL